MTTRFEVGSPAFVCIDVGEELAKQIWSLTRCLNEYVSCQREVQRQQTPWGKADPWFCAGIMWAIMCIMAGISFWRHEWLGVILFFIVAVSLAILFVACIWTKLTDELRRMKICQETIREILSDPGFQKEMEEVIQEKERYASASFSRRLPDCHLEKIVEWARQVIAEEVIVPEEV